MTIAREVAVRQGFEPWVRYKRTLVFKTSAFNRSATSPQLVAIIRSTKGNVKGFFTIVV
jgi:hypothetical protein